MLACGVKFIQGNKKEDFKKNNHRMLNIVIFKKKRDT